MELTERARETARRLFQRSDYSGAEVFLGAALSKALRGDNGALAPGTPATKHLAGLVRDAYDKRAAGDIALGLSELRRGLAAAGEDVPIFPADSTQVPTTLAMPGLKTARWIIEQSVATGAEIDIMADAQRQLAREPGEIPLAGDVWKFLQTRVMHLALGTSRTPGGDAPKISAERVEGFVELLDAFRVQIPGKPTA